MVYDSVVYFAAVALVVSYLAMASIYFVMLILVSITQSSIISIVKPSLLQFTPKNRDISVKNPLRKEYFSPAIYRKKQDVMDITSAKHKARVIKAARSKRKDLEKGVLANIIKRSGEKQRYHLDPLLNLLKRRSGRNHMSLTDDSSSSLELRNWKEEWKEHWLQKKFEAINSSRPKGDTVNMAAARPWGLPCGDPNQHDMPWGSCMLPMECDAEFRIFRGDHFCGRTQFVCCALQLTTYDMYQGFDVSFDDSSLKTDTEEKKNRDASSKERRQRKKYRNQRKRRNERLKRKRKMKRNIKKIVRQIKKILNRHYRNGTTERSRKTRLLKKFIKVLKKKFKEERKVIKDLHEISLIKADAEIQGRLNQIKTLNEEFMKNDTFREIVVNGTINKNSLNVRTLIEGYPELASMFQTRRGGVQRPRDYLDYDIEYGYLYY